MLVKTIRTAYELKEAMKAAERDCFSVDACEALIESFEESLEPVELDPIAMACEFCEETPAYIAEAYGYTVDGLPFDAAMECGDYDRAEIIETFVNDYLNYRTWAVELPNGNILYQNF